MQNNFVMKAKNVIKKVAALAGTAIMASSMVAPVMAATLANLPAPFVSNGVFNANIVVGSSGTAAGISSDLAGAMDVAAAFAQKASATSTSSGSITLQRPMTPGRFNSSGTTDYISLGKTIKAATYTSSVDGFEWLVNKTLNYNDTDYPVVESIQITNTYGSKLNFDGKFSLLSTDLEYKISYNGTAGYEIPQGIAQFPIFGMTYQIVDVPANNEITFGQMTDSLALSSGSTVTIPGKATIYIDTLDTLNKEVKIKVTAANGTVMFNDYVSATSVGTEKIYEGYRFTVKNLRGVSGGYTVDLSWTSSAITLRNGGNASSIDPSLSKWSVGVVSNSTSDKLSSISFYSPSTLAGGTINLAEGEYNNVMNYFNITFEEFDAVNQTSVAIREGIEDSAFSNSMTYTNDANETTVGVYLGSHYNVPFTGNSSEYITMLTAKDVFKFVRGANASHNWLQVWNSTLPNGVMVGTLFNTSYGNVTTFGTSGALYTLNWNMDYLNASINGWVSQDTAVFGSGEMNYLKPLYMDNATFNTTAGQMGLDGFNGTLRTRANGEEEVLITFEDSLTKKVELQTLPTAQKELADEATKYTAYGTIATRANEVLTLVVPEKLRTANIWVGRSAIEELSLNVGDEIEGEGWSVAGSSISSSGGVTPIVPGIGASAAMYTTPINLVKPTIIIGGGNANLLTAELAENEEGVTTATLVAATNKAYLQLIENAFGGSQTVLVVAGRDAKDTKLACQALAAHVAGTRALSLTGNLVWLDTSASTYTSVSVAQ